MFLEDVSLSHIFSWIFLPLSQTSSLRLLADFLDFAISLIAWSRSLAVLVIEEALQFGPGHEEKLGLSCGKQYTTFN